MGDLISRKWLVKELLKERDQYSPLDRRIFTMTMRGGIHKALRLVETAPSIEAEPVRHSKWMVHTPNSGRCRRIVGCAQCHAINYGGVFYHFNYCPYCGAKMDGDK